MHRLVRAERPRGAAVTGTAERTLTDPIPRVLVCEPIAEAGIELLRREFDVELMLGGEPEELERRIGEFDAILIRSQTAITAPLIERADRLRVIGRAGTGVDNVDLEAATKRGIVVANAPESNSIAAAEHTMALALALCRNVPQAHGSLVAGDWARSRYGGSELYGKTLGVIGFGRIGQLVAKRALGFEMDVVAFDRFVAPERFRELGVEGLETVEELYGRADVITIHVPRTPDTVNLSDLAAKGAVFVSSESDVPRGETLCLLGGSGSGKSVTLKPGGTHVMLMDLKEPVTGKEKIDLDLKFENAGDMKVEAPVKKLGE